MVLKVRRHSPSTVTFQKFRFGEMANCGRHTEFACDFKDSQPRNVPATLVIDFRGSAYISIS